MSSKGTPFGSIELILGGMYAGKTRELFRRLGRYEYVGEEVALYKYIGDIRYSRTLAASHDGIEKDAQPIGDAKEINWKPGMVIGIDEGQFIDNIAEVAEIMANAGVRVIIAGLNSDWQREAFPRITALIPKAEKTDVLHAICNLCKQDASFSKRIVESSEQELIGGTDKYIAVCRECWNK